MKLMSKSYVMMLKLREGNAIEAIGQDSTGKHLWHGAAKPKLTSIIPGFHVTCPRSIN